MKDPLKKIRQEEAARDLPDLFKTIDSHCIGLICSFGPAGKKHPLAAAAIDTIKAMVRLEEALYRQGKQDFPDAAWLQNYKRKYTRQEADNEFE